jgi:hypothetical protein
MTGVCAYLTALYSGFWSRTRQRLPQAAIRLQVLPMSPLRWLAFCVLWLTTVPTVLLETCQLAC